MPKLTAHNLDEKWRSDDIRTGEDVEFSSLLLPKEILQGLTAAGFKYPSPIQLKAIPATRIGKDVIIQAKSGTGKTLVFAVAALNVLMKRSKHPQVLIMAPTREIACQISQVIDAISVGYKGIKSQYFIGGFKAEDDVQRIEGCQIVVGTPGRIRYLIAAKILKTSGIRLFVFDEADQLLRESSFEKDMNDIFRSLPRDKQIIATSATYQGKLKKLIDKYFREPIVIRLNDKKVALLGMVHYCLEIPVVDMPVLAYRLKLKALKDVLQNVKFAQCLVFCNMVSRVENLCVEIKKMGFATSFISSAREQADRLKAIEMLRRFKCKVLVASDVSSRGIDAENVDLVINFDLPPHLDIYFHRVGRAGRYGSKCASVTFIISSEMELFEQMEKDGNFESHGLPNPVPSDLISRELSDVSDSDSDAEGENKNGEDQQEKINDFSNSNQTNGKKVESESNSDSDSDVEDLKENGKARQKNTEVLNINSNPTNEGCALSSTFQLVKQKVSESEPPVFRKIRPEKETTEAIVEVEEENSKLKVNGNNIEDLCVNDEQVGEKSDQQSCASSVIENTKNGLSSDIHKLKQSTDAHSYLADLESGPEKSLESKTNNDELLVVNNGSISKSFSNLSSNELICSVITFIEKYEKQKDSADCSTSNSIKSSERVNVEPEDNKFSPASLISLRSNLSQYYYNIYKKFIVNIPEVWIKEITPEYGKVKNANQVLEIGSQNDLNQIHDGNKIPDSDLNVQHPLFSTPKRGVQLGSNEESSSYDENELTEQFNLLLKNRHSKEVECISEGADVMINHELITQLENEEIIERLGCNNETVDKGNEKDISDAKSDSDVSVQILFDSRQHRINEETIDVKSDSELDSSVEYLYVSKERMKEGIEIGGSTYNFIVPESESNSQLDSDTSINDKDTMDILNEEFNKDRAESCNKERFTRIVENNEKASINKADSSVKILFDSCRKSGEPQNNDEIFCKFVNNVLAYEKSKQNNAIPIKDAKNMSRFPLESQSNSNRSESITKVDAKKHAESPSSTSSNNRGRTVKPKKGVDRVIQNGKNEVANTKKFSEVPIWKTTKTVKGPAQNKITYFIYDTESDDQLPLEAQSSLQDGYQRKTRRGDRRVTKIDGARGKELTNKRVEKNIEVYNFESESSSSEAGISCHQYSKVCDFNPRGRHNRKRVPKKDETLSQTESSGFGYSTDTSNSCFNPSYSKPCSQQSQNRQHQRAYHSNHQMQPSYGASSLCYDRYPQQSPHRRNQRGCHSCYQNQSATNGPNPYYQIYPRRDPNHKCCTGFSTNNHNAHKNLCPLISNALSIREMQPSHNNFNPCCVQSQHPCHPPNENCQSVICATWYDIFYKQWQLLYPNGSF